MKRTLTFLTFWSFLLIQGYSQPRTQRVILFEEFTQASSQTCYPVNQNLKILLDANKTKVIPLTYHLSWPGIDPMYEPSYQANDARETYYNISSVPYGMMDGNAWQSSPANLTQSDIDSHYGVASPFNINLLHSFINGFDSIFIMAKITATSSINSGNFRAHMVIAENHVHYNISPGTNFENDFYHVMRQMLPDGGGEVLPSNWTLGQEEDMVYRIAMPANIVNSNEIEIIFFIQNNNDKNVLQTAFSPNYALTGDSAADAGISRVIGFKAFTCNPPFDIKVTLKNYGNTPLNRVDLNWQIDNEPVQTTFWNNTLSGQDLYPLDTAQITIPGITSLFGTHQLRVFVSKVNGDYDLHPNNNYFSRYFLIADSTYPLPVSQDFEGNTFPPKDWLINNPLDTRTWVKKQGVGGFGTSNNCAMMEFWKMRNANEVDELWTPPLDIPKFTKGLLLFDVAYAPFSTNKDGLKVMVSSDCGNTWIKAYDKSGSTLATAPEATIAFVPNATQWRTDTVNLAPFANNSRVLIKFVATNAFGNNLYLDNIRTDVNTGINNRAVIENSLAVYPNPAANDIVITLESTKPGNAVLVLYSAMGQSILFRNLGLISTGSYSTQINCSGFNPGIYLLELTLDGQKFNRKISIIK